MRRVPGEPGAIYGISCCRLAEYIIMFLRQSLICKDFVKDLRIFQGMSAKANPTLMHGKFYFFRVLLTMDFPRERSSGQ